MTQNVVEVADAFVKIGDAYGTPFFVNWDSTAELVSCQTIESSARNGGLFGLFIGQDALGSLLKLMTQQLYPFVRAVA